MQHILLDNMSINHGGNIALMTNKIMKTSKAAIIALLRPCGKIPHKDLTLNSISNKETSPTQPQNRKFQRDPILLPHHEFLLKLTIMRKRLHFESKRIKRL
jgi:hypothetical protein